MSKTAMRELIEWLEKQLSNEHLSRDNKSGLEIAIEQCHKYTEKEKEQIVNAYIEGNRNGLNNKALGANKYYRETYNT